MGSITSTGYYTAPTTAGSDVVTVRSIQDTTKSATASLTVIVPASISSVSVSPSTVSLNTSSQSQFTVVVTGVGNYSSSVAWTAQRGSISSTGLYTAPPTGGSDVVTATSIQNSSKFGSASVSAIEPAPETSSISSVSITPSSVVLAPGAQYQFNASVTGSGNYNPGVIWTVQGGSISSTGIYSAPATGGNFSVTATSVQDQTKTATASVSVAPSDLPSWTGAGKTILVPVGGDIQAAINSASAGDTITLADGVWTGVHLAISKKIRLMAVNPLRARLEGHAQPTDGADTGIVIKGSAATGTFIQDLDVSWYGDFSICAEDSGNVVISGCKIESSGNFGILLWGTADALVYGNSFFDPYLPGMLPTLVDNAASTNWVANNNLVLMDYAVASYGTVHTKVVQNYFHGQFNQVVSFKEGNRDYTVRNNTFEGFAGTGVLCGQNIASYGPYSYSGQPKAIDTGTLHIDGNVFRPKVGLQQGQLAEYRANSAIRMGHLNQAIVYVSGNLIEAAITGLSLEQGINGSVGGPTGILYADHNIINGDIYDDGTMVSPTAKVRKVGSWRAVLMNSGVQMNVVITNDTYANSACAIQNEGLIGSLTVDRTIFLKNGTSLSGGGTVSNSIFWPGSALPGVGNLVADPLVGSATVPLLKLTVVTRPPTSDLTTRFRPSNTSPAKRSDGTYIGAVAP
jgi:parallel beta-helix repeat protein